MFKPQKVQEVEKLAELIHAYSVVGVLNIHKMPTKQMQKIKVNMRGKAKIRAGKNILIRKALEKSNLSGLINSVSGESSLILSNENPFRLYSILKENRIPSAAKTGDIAADDIVVRKGSTGLPPGPAITTLQKAGLKTTVENGKISIPQDKVALKKGEKVTRDLANVFNLLKMEPMKIGIDMVAAWEHGTIYAGSVLDIDKDEYKKKVGQCIAAALNLSVNAGYPTKDSIRIIIQKAFHEAKSLIIGANIIDKDFIGEVLAKAAREAAALESAKNI